MVRAQRAVHPRQAGIAAAVQLLLLLPALLRNLGEQLGRDHRIGLRRQCLQRRRLRRRRRRRGQRRIVLTGIVTWRAPCGAAPSGRVGVTVVSPTPGRPAAWPRPSLAPTAVRIHQEIEDRRGGAFRVARLPLPGRTMRQQHYPPLVYFSSVECRRIAASWSGETLKQTRIDRPAPENRSAPGAASRGRSGHLYMEQARRPLHRPAVRCRLSPGLKPGTRMSAELDRGPASRLRRTSMKVTRRPDGRLTFDAEIPSTTRPAATAAIPATATGPRR